MIYLTLFWEFAKVGIFCVGGGYASMPLIQVAVVDTYRWMSLGEFVDIFTISQMTPGPIGINAATFAGMKIAGIPGALCATVGFCTPSLILGIVLAKLFFKYGDIGPIRGILNGLRPAVVALIAAAGISFVVLALWNEETLPEDLTTIDPLGVIILLVSLAAVRRKIGVIKLLAATGVAGFVLGIIQQNLLG
ncbi:chromate transporter [Selenomonas ruminantium]|uniref:Chromate transporter n=1 Tax=Selenomonas ruminantium TaxID=971 RepID=A0A1H3VH60_SELRU|nr:chromate transporter [Selenomonas ruminantium]SDZ73518.1 chromate transporter [Selenomonas ruminantium]